MARKTEELEAVIAERGLRAPRLIGIPMELPDFSLDDALAELERFIGLGG